MPSDSATLDTPSERAIGGSDVLMIAPSRFCMNEHTATTRATVAGPRAAVGRAGSGGMDAVL